MKERISHPENITKTIFNKPFSVILCLLIGVFSSFAFNVITDKVRFMLKLCYLLSICLMSSSVPLLLHLMPFSSILLTDFLFFFTISL